MPHTYDYPRPALTVDCVVFSAEEDQLEVLLIRRDQPPFEGQWAAPGGFVDIDEPIIDAAYRELAEETGLRTVELNEYGTFGTPGRDPRGRTVSVAHWGLCRACDHTVLAGDDAGDFGWFPVDRLPEMAFDHDTLVPAALTAIRARARCGPIGRDVLDAPFDLDELRALYRTVLDTAIDREQFQRFLMSDPPLLLSVDGGYEFDDGRYEQLICFPPSPFVEP